jgi:ribose transport system permease protein
MTRKKPLISKHFLRRPSSTLLVTLAPVLGFVILVMSAPAVWSRNSVMSLLVLASVLGIASIGQTWALLIGSIDLSLPAVIGMANVVLATLYARGIPFEIICLVLVGLSLALGLVNGVITSVLNLHPLVVTLGVGSIVTGAVLAATNGNTGGVVPSFINSAVSPVGRTFGVPVPASFVLWITISAIVLYLERRSVLGRRILALGSNPTAARLVLIRPVVIRTAVFALSALCGCVAGLLLGGFSGGAAADIGNPYLFSTITAVVIGGTSLLGGRGSYARTISGVLVTTEFATFLVGRGVGPDMQQVFLGLIVLVLITVYGRDRRLAQRI